MIDNEGQENKIKYKMFAAHQTDPLQNHEFGPERKHLMNTGKKL